MKKSTLFLACCIGLMFLASCKKDPVAPTISAITDTGYVTENAQIFSGDNIKVGFNATGEKLTKIEITLTQNGIVINSSQATIENLTSFSHTAAFTVEATGTVTITGIVTDANGLNASKSFNIIFNEKPNAKFLGHYEGNALATGMMEAEITGIGVQPVHDGFTDREVPVILDLTGGENMNEVVGTCKINDREMTCKGTVDGNKLVFEAVNDVFTFEYNMGLITINPEINVTYTIVGTLVESQLNLEGTCTGNGDLNYGLFSGTIKLESTVGGSLNKMQ